MPLGANATITATIDQGRRIFNINNGGKLVIIEIGMVTAANVIVAGAITLDSTDFRRMGLSKLLSILHGAAWTSANAFVPLGNQIWDAKGSKLMLYDPAGAALTAAAIGNGGALRLTMLGM